MEAASIELEDVLDGKVSENWNEIRKLFPSLIETHSLFPGLPNTQRMVL